MFKVVIIDDEALVRIGIKSIINWEEQDCELIGEAANGQLGYDLIKNKKPDIVITDIKMPVMDGLQMIEQLVNEGIKSKFVILSGYDEFELVRRAMKYGVDEYLIKLELEPEVLINILSRIKEKIMSDYKRKNEEYKLEKHMRDNKYFMREDLFKRIIGKTIDDSEIKDELKYQNIKLTEKNISFIIIQIKDAGKFEKYNETDLNLLEFSILNILDEIVNDFFTAYSFKLSIKEYAIIFSSEDISEEEFRKKVDNMTERLITMLKQYFNIHVIIGVSDKNNGFSNIDNAYMQCIKALKQSFYNGSKNVIYFNNLNLDNNIDKNANVYEISDDLLKYIELSDIEAIEITFQNIIDILKEEKLSRKTAYDVCGKIAYLITTSVENNEENLEQIFGDGGSIFEKISKLASIEEIILWLENIKKGLCSLLLSRDKAQNNKIITKAKKVVRENVDKTISLHDIAGILNISPGYFSTIFKQYTGISFIDYVTEVRIDEAKKLLKESNYKIYQIAQMTGYENAYYFSKVFKKVTGITPKEFEKNPN